MRMLFWDEIEEAGEYLYYEKVGGAPVRVQVRGWRGAFSVRLGASAPEVRLQGVPGVFVQRADGFVRGGQGHGHGHGHDQARRHEAAESPPCA